MRYLAILLLVFASTVGAQVIRRCVDSEGHVTFTNTSSCPSGTVEHEAKRYRPEPNRPNPPLVVHRERPRSFYYEQYRPKRRTWRDDCLDARAEIRRQMLVTKKPTYQDRRRWNDVERNACKGRDPDI